MNLSAPESSDRRTRYNQRLLAEGTCVHCAVRPRAIAANGGVLQHCQICRQDILDKNNARAERMRKAREIARELAMATLRSPDANVARLAADYLEMVDGK